jgi:hypothetical protein
LLDESRGRIYDPRDYPEHGTGLFFVGVETNGMIAGYALRSGGAFNRILTITSGLPSVMDLHFDRETHDLWAVCRSMQRSGGGAPHRSGVFRQRTRT